MDFDPNEPQNGEVVDADVLRGQLNALNDKIDGSGFLTVTSVAGGALAAATVPVANLKVSGQMFDGAMHPSVRSAARQLVGSNGTTVALDWSNGAPKLPSFEDIANPVLGNLAFDYGAGHLMVYDGQDWQTLG